MTAILIKQTKASSAKNVNHTDTWEAQFND